MAFRTGVLGKAILDIYQDMDTAFSSLEGTLTAEYDAIVAETTTVGRKLKLVEGTDNGTSAVTMAAPASLGGDRTITLPDADVDLTELNTLAARYRVPALTVNPEDTNAIQVDVQISDLDGSVAEQRYVRVTLLNANPDGDGSKEISISVTSGGVGSAEWVDTIMTGAPSGGNEEGIMVGVFRTDANGLLNIDITDTSAGNDKVYLVVEVLAEAGGTRFFGGPAMAVAEFTP